MRHMKRVQPVAGPFQKLKENKKAVAMAAVALVVVGGGGLFFFKLKKAPVHHADGASPEQLHGEAKHGEAKHGEAKHGEEHHAEAAKEEHTPAVAHPSRFFGRPWQVLENINETVHEIRRLDLENQRLKLENAQLRLRLESSEFEASVVRSKALTEAYASQIEKTAGNRVGRTIASITYQPPTHLLPQQLHALGVSQFRAHEYDKAAKIFTLLSELAKGDTYKTSGHRLLTGITWYRLKNWDMADTYFDQILSQAGEQPSDTELKHLAQARLWKALLAHQRGRKSESQKWMSELVEHHPRSPEAGWINILHEAGGPRVRVPASHH
jgi:TolA-binding protein